MKFYYKLSQNIYEGTICIAEDTSVIFEELETDLDLGYTISLGGDWRYLMDLSHKTGRCGPLRCFLEGVDVYEEKLSIPKCKKGELYFVDDEEMTEYSGTMYFPFENKCYYDEKSNILCIGNPYSPGETIEFVSNTYAVINGNRLAAVFMIVNSLKEMVTVQKGQFQGIGRKKNKKSSRFSANTGVSGTITFKRKKGSGRKTITILPRFPFCTQI